MQTRIFSINLGGGGAPVDPFTLIGRAGEATIADGATSVNVLFSVPLGNTNYAITCSVVNTTDAVPMIISPEITAKSTTGFTAYWGAGTDSANYVLNYLVAAFV